MTELTSKTFAQIAPNAGKKMIWATGTSAANGDTLTVTGLQTIESCIGFATDGTPGTYTITGSTNVITLTNGGTKTWNYLCVGY